MMGMGEKPEIYKTKTKEKIPRLVALPSDRAWTDLVLELLIYMVDGPAHCVGKVGDTQ